jgi:hypothetical protein
VQVSSAVSAIVKAIAADRLFWVSSCALAADANAQARPMAAGRMKIRGMLPFLPRIKSSWLLGMRLGRKAYHIPGRQ